MREIYDILTDIKTIPNTVLGDKQFKKALLIYQSLYKKVSLFDELLKQIVISGDCPNQLNLDDSFNKDEGGSCSNFGDVACEDCWLRSLEEKINAD